MFVLSRTPGPLPVGCEDGVHRPRRVLLLDAEGKNVEFGFEDGAGIPAQHLEMLERIRVAAGQTS